MKKIILPILCLTLLAWCGTPPADTTREDTSNWLIDIMSWNTYKRTQADLQIQKNNDLIAKYEDANQKLENIKTKMSDENAQNRITLCNLIGKDEKWNECDK